MQKIGCLDRFGVRLFCYLAAASLYSWVGLTTWGFDDEFYNIHLIQQFGLDALRVTQVEDIHPPLQYVLNALLYQWLGEWSAVRVVSGLATVFTASLLSEYLVRRKGALSGLLVFLLICLNPAVLMWATSVRWYAYFLPVLIWALMVPEGRLFWVWGKFFVVLTILAYISYIALLFVPALLIWYLHSRTESIKACSKWIISFGSIALLLFTPQLINFFGNQYNSVESQASTLMRSVIGVFVGHFSNQGVFPLSFAGLLSAAGAMLALILQFRTERGWRQPAFAAYVAFVGLAVVTGLAGKFRNLVVATPLQALWLSSGQRGERQVLWGVALACIGLANLVGVVNVVRHEGTTKNGWNLPVAEVLQLVRKESKACGGDLLVLAHDPTLSFWISGEGVQVVGPHGNVSKGELPKSINCLIALLTYPGSIPEDLYDLMLEDLRRLHARTVLRRDIGVERHVAIKRMLDPRFQNASVQVVILSQVENVFELKYWM